MLATPTGSDQDRDLGQYNMNLTRRNGKPSSCEPCRKLKARCDHKTPVCGRCRSRCIAHHCYYHPAPLTQPKLPGTGGVGMFPIVGNPVWATSLPLTPYHEEFNSQVLDAGSASIPEPYFSSAITIEAASSHSGMSVPELQLHQVLSRLSQIEVVGKLVRRWWRVSPSGPVPRLFFDKVLDFVDIAAHRLKKGHPEARRLATDIKEASLRPWTILSDTHPREISGLLTEPNLRIEAIGIILATAGTAALCLLESDILFSVLSFNKEDRRIFARDMLSASDTCIEFCDDGSGLHDLMIWLRYANFLLTLNFCGYADHRTWSRSGQLFGDAFAMGMHRDPGDSLYNTPFFLEEIRTRLFSCLYTHDKVLSNILGKLPRIPRHYCSRKLPLDMSDEKLLSPGSTLEETLLGLDSEDGNEEGSCSVDLLRARYEFATIREDILSVRLGTPKDDDESFLRRIPTRITTIWGGLPSRVRFDPNAPDPDKPQIYMANLLLYLEYLDLHFSAQKLLCAYTGRNDDPNYLQQALTLMTTTVNCARRSSRQFGASKEMSSLLWIYGLPSAIVLANAMRQRAELGQDMPHLMSWATLYRQLSVLASELEANADPNDGNFPFYSERSKLLSEQLDRALNARHCRDSSDATSSIGDSGLVSTTGTGDFEETLTNMAMDDAIFGT